MRPVTKATGRPTSRFWKQECSQHRNQSEAKVRWQCRGWGKWLFMWQSDGQTDQENGQISSWLFLLSEKRGSLTSRALWPPTSGKHGNLLHVDDQVISSHLQHGWGAYSVSHTLVNIYWCHWVHHNNQKLTNRVNNSAPLGGSPFVFASDIFTSGLQLNSTWVRRNCKTTCHTFFLQVNHAKILATTARVVLFCGFVSPQCWQADLNAWKSLRKQAACQHDTGQSQNCPTTSGISLEPLYSL